MYDQPMKLKPAEKGTSETNEENKRRGYEKAEIYIYTFIYIITN